MIQSQSLLLVFLLVLELDRSVVVVPILTSTYTVPISSAIVVAAALLLLLPSLLPFVLPEPVTLDTIRYTP